MTVCYHLTLLPTHSDTLEYQCKFRWYSKSWSMEQKKQSLKLPSVYRVMSVFSLSPTFLFFWIIHLPSRWTVSPGNSLYIFTTHFFEIYFNFLPDNSICQLKCCVQFLLSHTHFVHYPNCYCLAFTVLEQGDRQDCWSCCLVVLVLVVKLFSAHPVGPWLVREGG